MVLKPQGDPDLRYLVLFDEIETAGKLQRQIEWRLLSPYGKVTVAGGLTTDLREGAEIVAPVEPEWARLGRRLREMIRAHAGVDLPIVDPESLAPLPDGRHRVLLGNAMVNGSIMALYRRQYAFLDDWYPGGDGYAVRTVHNPENCGYNALLVGGSTLEGAANAVEVMECVLEETGGRLGYTNRSRSEVHEMLLPEMTTQTFREWVAEMYGNNLSYYPVEQGTFLGLVHHLTHNPGCARMFRTRYFKTETPPPLEIRQNHWTFAGLSGSICAEYFQNYYGITGFEKQIRFSRTVFDGQANSYKPNDDAGGGWWGYCWLAPHHQVIYDLKRDDYRFLENGQLRAFADYGIQVTDNLGVPVSFGDMWSYIEQGRYAVAIKNKTISLELAMALCTAAWYYGDVLREAVRSGTPYEHRRAPGIHGFVPIDTSLRRLWEAQVRGPVRCADAKADSIAVGTGSGHVALLSGTGKKRWRRDLDGGVTGLILLKDDEAETIVAGTTEGWVVFLSLDGEVVGSHRMEAGVTVLTRLALPGLSGLLVGTHGGGVSAVSPGPAPFDLRINP